MSKTYRLIKEYPNSPKLGSICYVHTNNFLENYPEYWQEISECKYIKGKVYFVKTKYEWLIRFDRITDLQMYGTSYICLSNLGNSLGFRKSYANILPTYSREATEDEIKWLEACEEANRFIPKEEALNLKKEWEITAIQNNDKSLIIWFDSNGNPIKRSWGNENLLSCTFNLNCYLTDKHARDLYHIYSVKRLSDGVEFKIGDKVNTLDSKNPVNSIHNFYIEGDKLYMCIHDIGGVDITHTSYNKIEKLFTGEDGVDIYKGDNWYVVYTKYVEDGITIQTGGCELWNAYGNTTRYSPQFKSIKRFSTKEAAEKYVIYNKPCLSINDLIDNSSDDKYIDFEIDSLEELVQNKLNGNK